MILTPCNTIVSPYCTDLSVEAIQYLQIKHIVHRCSYPGNFFGSPSGRGKRQQQTRVDAGMVKCVLIYTFFCVTHFTSCRSACASSASYPYATASGGFECAAGVATCPSGRAMIIPGVGCVWWSYAIAVTRSANTKSQSAFTVNKYVVEHAGATLKSIIALHYKAICYKILWCGRSSHGRR
jgi:hypothetical protein